MSVSVCVISRNQRSQAMLEFKLNQNEKAPAWARPVSWSSQLELGLISTRACLSSSPARWHPNVWEHLDAPLTKALIFKLPIRKSKLSYNFKYATIYNWGHLVLLEIYTLLGSIQKKRWQKKTLEMIHSGTSWHPVLLIKYTNCYSMPVKQSAAVVHL